MCLLSVHFLLKMLAQCGQTYLYLFNVPVECALFAKDVGTVWTDDPLHIVEATHVGCQVRTLLKIGRATVNYRYK